MKQLNIPMFVTELKKKIRSNFLPGNSPGLKDQQIYGIMFATVEAHKTSNVMKNIIKDAADENTVSIAESAVAFVRSKNKHNIFYHLESDIVIETKDDGLSRTRCAHTKVLEKQYKDSVDFMLYAMAASFVLDFDYYINIRKQFTNGHYINDKAINSAIRIVASTQKVFELIEVDADQKIKILIVDDEIRFARLLKLILVRTGKFDIRTENRGANALNTARAFKPDLILLDMIMPDMGGEEVAQQIRDDTELCNTKIIILSALLTRDETGNTGREIGGYTRLTKCVKHENLLCCIEGIFA